MATHRPTSSAEETVKRLQIVMQAVSDSRAAPDQDLARLDGDIREIKHLTADLAGRIHADPASWGLSELGPDLRDDVATDALVGLLTSLSGFRGESVSGWFSSEVQARRDRLKAMDEAGGDEPPAQGEAPAALPVFSSGLWKGFEEQFPREAFVLRLRYLLKRTPEQMQPILEAPTLRAVGMRLNRARDRFKRFCEQSGADAGMREQWMADLGEVRT